MKRFFKTLGIIFLVLFVISIIINAVVRPQYENSLDYNIERADKGCPISVAGGVGQVSHIRHEGNNIVYYIDYKAGNFNTKAFSDNPEQARQLFYLSNLCLNGQNGQGNFLMQILEQYNLGMKVVVTDGLGGTFESTLSQEYIKNKRKEVKANPSQALRQGIALRMEMESMALPQEIEQGMVMTAIRLRENNIVMDILLDEELYDIAAFKQNYTAIHDEILNNFDSVDGEIAAFLDLCMISKTGLVYQMIGKTSNRSVDIVFTSSEISSKRHMPV